MSETKKDESSLSDLLCGDSEVRQEFEKIMRSKHYTVMRDNFGEYIQAAVFHMWTGYCLASTGWANGDHVDYCELPIHWDELSDNEKEEWAQEAAQEYMNEVCSFCGEIVDDE